MNDTLTAIKTRRSVRAFLDKQITDEELRLVLEAGEYAPSGMNRQPVQLIAVQNAQAREKLSRLNASFLGGGADDPYYGAPTIVLVLVERDVSTRVEDASLAMGNMMVAAHSLGLGSCWVHREHEMFDSDEGKALLREWGIAGDYQGVGACILGYCKGDLPAPPPRKERRTHIVK